MTRTTKLTSFFQREYKAEKRVAIMARIEVTEDDSPANRMIFEIASSANPSHAAMVVESLNENLRNQKLNLQQYLF